MKDLIFSLFVVYLILFIPISAYLDAKIEKYQLGNTFLNWFLVFSAMFANPGTLVVSYIIAGNEFKAGLSTLARVLLFFALIVAFSALRFCVWAYKNKQQVKKESLFIFSKKFAFQIPFLLFTLGLFDYGNGEMSVPMLACWLLTLGIGYSFVIAFIKYKFERKVQ